MLLCTHVYVYVRYTLVPWRFSLNVVNVFPNRVDCRDKKPASQAESTATL